MAPSASEHPDFSSQSDPVDSARSVCSPVSVQVASLGEAYTQFQITNDEIAFLRFIRLHWSVGDLVQLLNSAESSLAVLASHALGVLGGKASVFPLAGALRRDETDVVGAAEDALWRVWFTEFGRDVRRRLREAVDLIEQGRRFAAIAVLDHILERDPSFSEAYHQRALAYYLDDAHAKALRDALRAVAINPCHFGAHVQAGHAHAALHQYEAALMCYHDALCVHPRLPGVRQNIRRIRGLMGDVPSFTV